MSRCRSGALAAMNQLLEPPEVPGHSAAWLCLNAPSSWSGEFMEFDDPRIPAVP
ncbi:MAG: hypothetical protein SWC40_09315 [Thermodesulfobacteriota bacterium]|nr:hypothetical protein [Thermodesulfobacteriota bacterium]